MSIERIKTLLEKCDGSESNFSPTVLYNEGWMLRLVLDWLSSNSSKFDIDHDLTFKTTDQWYSEALLPTVFNSVKGKKLGESWTHADGVIGNFIIGGNRKGDLSLTKDASRFLVIEAKMFSKLSPGVTNAHNYNQAARNVACIAEVIRLANIKPSAIEKIGFFLIAPDEQIRNNVFKKQMDYNNIIDIVTQRVKDYQEQEKGKWLKEWFMPTMEKIQIKEVAWEKLIELINQFDDSYGKKINEFYGNCLKFNRK